MLSGNSENERKERFEQLIFPIGDRSLEKRAEQAHAILYACRTYLPVFDSEAALVSEVYYVTVIPESTLARLPLQNFPEPRQQSCDELMAVFQNRKVGGVPPPGLKLVKITLLSDLHYAASLIDPNRCPVIIQDEHRAALRRHISDYLDGGEVNTLGVGNPTLWT